MKMRLFSTINEEELVTRRFHNARVSPSHVDEARF